MFKCLFKLLIVSAIVTGGIAWFEALEGSYQRQGKPPMYTSSKDLQGVFLLTSCAVIGCYGLYRMMVRKHMLDVAKSWAENGGVYTRNDSTNIRIR